MGRAALAMSPLPELDGERLKQKQKKNKIAPAQQVQPALSAQHVSSSKSGTSRSRTSCATEPSTSTFSLEPPSSSAISQEVRPSKSKESWQPQVPWLRIDGLTPDKQVRADKVRRSDDARRVERLDRDAEKATPEKKPEDNRTQDWQRRERWTDQDEKRNDQSEKWTDQSEKWIDQSEKWTDHSEKWTDHSEKWTDQEGQQWRRVQDQKKEWQRPQPKYESVKKTDNGDSQAWGWGNYVQVSDDGLLSIRLARMGLDYHALKSFCSWFPTELQRLKNAKARRLYVSNGNIVLAHDVDLSQNELDDEAIRILLLTLKQARVVVGVAKFYQNKLGCRSAILLSQWIRSAPWALFELHLSHNHIKTAGALELIKAIAETNSYPSARPGSKNWPLPLWLRLEHNDIPEADGFEQKAEHCLQAARPEAKGKLICWFTPRSEVGCRSDNCGHSTADHCPVIHIPHLHPERKGNGAARALPAKLEKQRPRTSDPVSMPLTAKAVLSFLFKQGFCVAEESLRRAGSLPGVAIKA